MKTKGKSSALLSLSLDDAKPARLGTSTKNSTGTFGL